MEVRSLDADPALSTRIQDVIRAGGRLIVRGEPGAGKSHLLGLVASALTSEMCVLRFASSRTPRTTAFGSLLEASGCPPAIPPLLNLDEEAGAVQAIRAAERLAGALRVRTGARSVVIVDEPDRLDSASAHLMNCLTGLPSRNPGLLVAVDASTAGDVDIPGAEIAEIEPYPDEILEAMVRDRFDSALHHPVRFEGAAGNPALAILAVSAVRWWDETSPAISIGSIPHLKRVSEEARNLARKAALLGPSFAVTSLSAVTDRTVTQLLPLLDELLAARIVEPQQTRLSFRHPWIHGALYGSVAPGVRAGLHREFADRIADARDMDAFDVAQQIARSPTPREADIALLRHASDLAMDRSPSDAVGMLVGAIKIAGPGHPHADELEAERLTALLATGRTAEARVLGQELLARGTSGRTESVVREALSRALLLENDLIGSVAQLDAAALAPSISQAEANRLLAERSLRHVLGGELALSRAEAETASRAATALGDDLGLSVASSTLAHAAYYSGDIHAAVDLARKAVQSADAASSDPAGRRARYELGMFLLHADRLEEASSLFRAEQRRAESLGSVWYSPLYHYGLGFSHFHTGALGAAEAEFRTGLELVTTAETRWESASARAHLAVIATLRGDWRQAGILVPDEGIAPSRVPHRSHDATLWARGHLFEARSALDAALVSLLAAAESAILSGTPVRLRWIVPDLVRVASAVGAASSTERFVETLESLAQKANTPYILGAARRARAIVTRDEELMIAALEAYRSSNRTLELAATLEEAGLLLAAHHRRDDAITFLDEAVQWYERMEASMPLTRVRSHLRALGVRRTARRRRPTEGWESLTDSEREIVGLVAQGMTNREIAGRLYISPRTVETHLRHVYGKLGLKSRIELATQAISRAW